jgi:hypothetical protein
MFIPGLKNSFLAAIITLEILMLSSRLFGFGAAFAVFGLLSVAAVGYFHLKLVKVKVRPIKRNMSEEEYRTEIKWLVVIAPLVVMWGNSFPFSGQFPGEYSIDVWKMVFFIAVILWFFMEGVFRIRF